MLCPPWLSTFRYVRLREARERWHWRERTSQTHSQTSRNWWGGTYSWLLLCWPETVRRHNGKKPNSSLLCTKKLHIKSYFTVFALSVWVIIRQESLEAPGLQVGMFMSVSSGGEMVETELRNIQIVTSPYTIHFRKTPKYFKPGMSFDVAVRRQPLWCTLQPIFPYTKGALTKTFGVRARVCLQVEVLNPDGSPAGGVGVVVQPGPVEGLTAANGMARLTVNTVATVNKLSVTVRML